MKYIWSVSNTKHICYFSVPEFGIEVSINEASMTGGLVQEYKHSVLPSIKPSVTFILTMLTMIPALVKLWYLGADKIYRSVSFVRLVFSLLILRVK